MSNRERVLAIIGAMQCVTEMVRMAHKKSPMYILTTAKNRCHAAVFHTSSWAYAGGTDIKCASHNAKSVLEAINNLPRTLTHEGANRYLKCARQVTKELETLIK